MSSSSSIIWLSLHHHLTWCHHRPITSSWNLSTNVSWSSATSWALPRYISNSWWEIPSLPLMICFIIYHFIAFRSTQTCSCFVLYLEFLATQHCSSLPWILPPFMSRMLWEFHHLLCILGTSDTSCHIRSFLDYWLLNHHSDIGRATQPIICAHLSTNV